MSEAKEVETVHTFSNDLNVLALRRDEDIGLSSSNRITSINNPLQSHNRAPNPNTPTSVCFSP
ncbi:hypothetical protein [Serratia proteamaculans]